MEIYHLRLSPESDLYTANPETARQQALQMAKDTGKAEVEVINERTGGGYILSYSPDGTVERMPRRHT